ncbi:MAG: fibrobacter succinogenes major paralogous domain-containing protein [Bacteroidetes bacterium]|nr:fibrobacter succinogenes major paralogous domain-containing protein [Bacteroidota bacterium]
MKRMILLTVLSMYIALPGLSTASLYAMEAMTGLPVVTTLGINNIAEVTAEAQGSVTDDGGHPLLDYGFCYATTPNPTLDDMVVMGNGDPDSFTGFLLGLSPSTTYYVRAFAENAMGVSYGNELNFTTLEVIPLFTVGGGVSDIDGNFYNTIILELSTIRSTIVTEWMAENLATSSYANGDAIPQVTDNTIWEGLSTGAFSYYNNDPSNNAIYGKFYNWFAANDPRGLCPNGWQLPGEQEWAMLKSFLGGDGEGDEIGINAAGGKMKSVGTTYWMPPNALATNASGFSGLPGGVLNFWGTFSSQGLSGEWWSSDESNATSGLSLTLNYNSGYALETGGPKRTGASVRCMRVVTPATTATIITSPVHTITSTSAVGGGNVTDDGGSAVTARGICWSTTPNPTINDNFTTNGSGTGSFSSSITGLSANTLYYVRAYATNGSGTVYGDELSFTTQVAGGTPADGEPCPNMPTITDADGNIYNTVLIGGQCWTKENLKTTKYRNGTNIQHPGADNSAWSSNTDGAYAWYNNDESWKDLYGALYNWYAVSNANQLCPEGWRVPTDNDWYALTDYISGGETNGGNQLKSCRQVGSPLGADCNTTAHPRWDYHETSYGTNDYGFGALPGGERQSGGTYQFLGSTGWWWSSTESTSGEAWHRSMDYHPNIWRPSRGKSAGLSVRCVRNHSGEAGVPVIETTTVTNITGTTATSGGTVTSSGGATVTQRGVVYGTAPNPTVLDNLTFDGSGTGSFQSQLENLEPGTTYYLRAYATNNVGTAYGSELVFTTTVAGANPCGGITTIVDADGNVYNTIEIGTQCWTKENLKTTVYNNNVPIDYPGSNNWAWENNTIGAYAWYNNDANWKDSYGALYNWHAVNSANKLCPEGWHVPTNDDWTTLLTFVRDATTQAGNRLKSCRQVNSPLGGECNTSTHPRWESHATHYGTDDHGYSALPGGHRNEQGNFFVLGMDAYFWSSSETSNNDQARAYTMGYSYGGAFQNPLPKAQGMAVRCIKTTTGQNTLPGVSTVSLTNATTFSVLAEGVVNVDGSLPVSDRGFVWATHNNPGLNDNVSFSGSGYGSFTKTISGLDAGTTYFVRAFATNALGTSFGETLSFTTLQGIPVADGSPCPDFESVTDGSGNVYTTTVIGNQCWTTANLASTKYRSGQPLALPGADVALWDTIASGAFAFNAHESYGYLYNWYAASSGLLCPEGWEVPSKKDFYQLMDYINGGHVNGAHFLKSCRQVNSPLGGDCSTTEHPRWNQDATHYGIDSYDFSALPGGFHGVFVGNPGNALQASGALGYWWTRSDSTQLGYTSGLAYRMGSFSDAVSLELMSRNYGFSIRCVRKHATVVTTPVVETVGVENVTSSTATAHGEVVGSGGARVTSRGVCYSTSPNPDINAQVVHVGNGTGTFTAEISGLLNETTYYMRAFAINSQGVSYGDELQFTTLAAGSNPLDGQPCPDMPEFTDLDGNTYKTVVIGNQCWMQQNLRTTVYSNGSPIDYPCSDLDAWETNTSGAYAVYENNMFFESRYGYLYNYHAVTNPAGLCPDGWRVPSQADWTALTTYISGGTSAGGKQLKSCRQVNNPYGIPCDTETHPRWDYFSDLYVGTNDYGFSALPGGARGVAGWQSNGYFALGAGGYWWSSTSTNASDAMALRLWYDSDAVFANDVLKGFGLSVRCVREYALVSLPQVTTDEVVSITDNSAIGGGNVVGDGNDPVTERGICWSTNPNPTIDEEKLDVGSGLGTFKAQMTNLSPNTSYYVRAYAINNQGVAYGNQVVFSTHAETACPNMPTVTDADGNTYTTVRIGTQCWMGENLRTTKYRNGTNIQHPGADNSAWSSNTTGAYAWYNNDESWKDLYGALYNWYAVSNANQLCPEGWRVPTDNDWYALTDYISGGEANGGNQLKSCRQVGSPLGADCNTTAHPRWDYHETSYGTDDYGFGALPGGERQSGGTYQFLGSTGWWWSSTESTPGEAWHRSMDYHPNIWRPSRGKSAGLSVRCVREQTISGEATVSTQAISGLTANSAISGGIITYDGGSNVTQRGVCWSTNPNPTTADQFTTDGSGTGFFTSYLTGLSPQTTYYVRAYATNANGTAYGNQWQFQTLSDGPSELPEVVTGSVTIVSPTQVTIGGEVTNDGNAMVTDRGIVWATTTEPTLANFSSSAGSGPGTFSVQLENLIPGMVYYARAYAVNSEGTAYGNEVSFKTAHELQVKVFLEGAYQTGGTMKNHLNLNHLVPSSQPYNEEPWNFESLADVPACVPLQTVDWVLVEIRQAASPELATPETILPGWPKSLLLTNNGFIVDPFGEWPSVDVTAGTENLYVVVRHRNHIDVMSSATLNFNGNILTYDFSTAVTQAYGGSLGYKAVEPGVYGMVAGDIDGDGQLSVLDFDEWGTAFGQWVVYSRSDVDMDALVSVLDFNLWSVNFGYGNIFNSIRQRVIYRSCVPGDK